MATLLFGVRITLQDSSSPVTTDINIGLYSVASSNSQLRWIQGPVNGVDNWNWTMLVKGGIGRFTREIDLRAGGNITSPGSCTVKVHNVHKLWKLCEDKVIYFPGLKCEIVRFDDYSQTIVWVGECQSPSWSLTEFTIPIKRTYSGRISNILTQINTDQFPEASSNTIGKTVPATFGKLIPSFSSDGILQRSSFAKFVRTLDKEILNYYSDDFFISSGFTETISFPVTDITDADSRIYICEFRGPGSGAGPLTPDNTYVKVVDGTGANQIRKIEGFAWTSTELTFVVEDFFETELVASGVDRSWVTFFKTYRRYDCDTFKCEGFFDKNETALVNGAELYTHSDDDGYLQIAPYGYEFQNVSDDNNKISIDPKLFDQGNLDSQNSLLILPVVDFELCSDNTLDNWGIDPSIIRRENGIYCDLFLDYTFSCTNTSHAVDKVSTTYCRTEYETTFLTQDPSIYQALVFDLPELPKGFTFSSLYLGIKMTGTMNGTSGAYPNVSNIKIMLRKFRYTTSDLSSNIDSLDLTSADLNTIDTMPDFYFTDSPATNNEHFFVLDTASAHDRTGYTLIDTGITTKDEYQSYIQGLILIEALFYPGSSSNFHFDTSIYEVCFMFKKSSDIKSNLYTPFHGRIFNDTFNSRKIALDLMTSPIDQFEHICRLQNFTDTGISQPSTGWGKTYGTSDLPIKQTGDGSFDDSELDDIKVFESAGQITDYNSGYTDEIKRSFCRDFHFANWIDSTGKECIRRLSSISPSPSDLVLMTDVIDRSSIQVTEHDISSTYVEPFVRYDKDPATDDLKSIIRIFNTSASAYNGSFVQGLTGSVAQELWTVCHNNWIKCKVINKPPTDMTDMTWANGYQSASIAEFHLTEWVNSMSRKEIQFTGHINDFGDWGECHRYMVQFPHHTNNEQKQCIAEIIDVNPNPPYDVVVKGLMV